MAAGYEGQFMAVDLAQGGVEYEVTHVCGFHGAAVDAGARWVALAGSDGSDGCVRMHRSSDWVLAGSGPSLVRCWCRCPGSSSLPSLGRAARSGPQRGASTGGCSGFTPPPKKLASQSGLIGVYAVENPVPLLDFQASPSAINALSFINGGRRLIAGGEDGRCRTWDLDAGAPFVEGNRSIRSQR